MGDSVFDAFYSSNVQFISNATYPQSPVQTARAQLLDLIAAPVWLLSHNQGAPMALLIADARPRLVRGFILLEPTGPPFQEKVFSSNQARVWGLIDILMNHSPAVTDPVLQLMKEVVQPKNSTNNATTACVLQTKTPKPRQLLNLAPLPILSITIEASYHAPYDYCTVEFRKQAGCTKAKHLELSKVGIRGNGHRKS
jgi:pimeloyl-ACP methyl ester carboxylesterase